MSSDPLSKYDSHGVNYCTRKKDTYAFLTPSASSNLAGRYVLVTGATRGIGRAIALSVARSSAAGIVLIDRDGTNDVTREVERTAREIGFTVPKIIKKSADITVAADVATIGAAIKETFDGKLDAIILNAGVLEPILKIVAQDHVKWWRSYEVFVLGSFLCLQTFIPFLRSTKDGLGTVLAVNSQAATMLRPGMSGMASAKLAQSKILDFVNAEYGTQEPGLTPLLAYCVHPGAVAHPERTDLPEALKRIQIDKPELPADTITWLVKERRQWLAGRFISCNWE